MSKDHHRTENFFNCSKKFAKISKISVGIPNELYRKEKKIHYNGLNLEIGFLSSNVQKSP